MREGVKTRVALLGVASLALVACGGKIRDDGDGDGAGPGGPGEDAGAEVGFGFDAGLDGADADVVVPLPDAPTNVSPTAVALLGVTPENWAIVRDSSGALRAAPLDGSPSFVVAPSYVEARVFDHVAFADVGHGTLVAWSLAGGARTLSTSSSIVGAVASADGTRVAWLETHDGVDDYRVAFVDGSGAALVSSVPSSSPCTHARAGSVGGYAIESTCEPASPTYDVLGIDLARGAPTMNVAPSLYASVDASARWAFVVLAGRDGMLARLDGSAQNKVASDVSSMGVFVPDASAVLVPTGARNAIVRVDVASGSSSPLGVNGTISYGDVSPDGETVLVDSGGGILALSSTHAPATSRSIGAGVVVGTDQLVGPFAVHASFTADGGFALFERSGGLYALALDADAASSVPLVGATHVGAVLPSRGSQIVSSVIGTPIDLFVVDARKPSTPTHLGVLPARHDFGLTADRAHVVWIEASGANKGLNVAPLPAP